MKEQGPFTALVFNTHGLRLAKLIRQVKRCPSICTVYTPESTETGSHSPCKPKASVNPLRSRGVAHGMTTDKKRLDCPRCMSPTPRCILSCSFKIAAAWSKLLLFHSKYLFTDLIRGSLSSHSSDPFGRLRNASRLAVLRPGLTSRYDSA